MFLLISNRGRHKENFIKTFLTKNGKYTKPKDFVIYNTKRNVFFDSRDFDIDKDISIIAKKANGSCGSLSPLEGVVLFFEDDFTSKEIHEIAEFCNKNKIKFFIFTLSGIPYSNEDIEIFESASDLFYETRTDLEKIKVNYRIALLGVTGVGKSSWINSVAKTDMIKTSPINTTKHTISTIHNIGGKAIEIIDTVGLENKTKQKLGLIKGMLIKTDYIFLFTDVINYFRRVNLFIANFLKRIKKKIFVILSKQDLEHDKSKIEEFIKTKIRVNEFIYTDQTQTGKNKKIIKTITSEEKESPQVKKLYWFLKDYFRNILSIKQLMKNQSYYKFVVARRHIKKQNIISSEEMESKIREFLNIKYIPIKIIFKYIGNPKNHHYKKH